MSVGVRGAQLVCARDEKALTLASSRGRVGSARKSRTLRTKLEWTMLSEHKGSLLRSDQGCLCNSHNVHVCRPADNNMGSLYNKLAWAVL